MADNELTLALAALTTKQRAVVKAVTGEHLGNQRKAYLSVYGPCNNIATTDAAATQVFSSIRVKRAIAAIEAENGKEQAEKAKSIIEKIEEIVEANKVKRPNIAIKGLELLGKNKGIWQADAPQDSKAIEIEESMRAELEEFAAWRIRQGIKTSCTG